MAQGDIDTKVYSEVISQLRNYTSKVSKSCADMSTAANTCIQTMNQDKAASASQTPLGKSITEITKQVSEINKVIAGMQQELEDAIKAQQISFDD